MTIWSYPKTQGLLAIFCALILTSNLSYGWQQSQPPSGDHPQAKGLPAGQLDSLVAPIALYPDPLLSQMLVAATYPLEIVEASRWLNKNSQLKGKDLTNAAAGQPWDASVQALVVFPDVLKQLNDNISWTTDLGNAFLAQQTDLMEAIQRLRVKAEQNGKLQSTPQQTVTKSNEGGGTYVEIQPASTEVIYVPQYEPVAVWGAPAYPYPPMVYPWVPGAAAISFGVGMAVGAIWSGGGGWGWHCNWGRNDVVINNNFIRNNHFNNVNVGNGNVWQHNSAHRQGVPYANQNVSNRFNQGNMNRVTRPTANQVQQSLGQANRQIGQGNPNRTPGLGQNSQGGANRMQGLGQGNQGKPALNPNNRPSAGGGGDRIGNRQVGGGGASQIGNRNAFGGMNQGGGPARMNSNRGSSSFGGSGFSGGGFGGGGSRGGGFGGGGGRGGGGRGGGGRGGGRR